MTSAVGCACIEPDIGPDMEGCTPIPADGVIRVACIDGCHVRVRSDPSWAGTPCPGAGICP